MARVQTQAISFSKIVRSYLTLSIRLVNSGSIDSKSRNNIINAKVCLYDIDKIGKLVI